MRPVKVHILSAMRWHFLQNINSLEIGESAEGHIDFSGDEPFFADHFPGFPVVPGVLQIEALAQISGKLIEVSIFDRYKRWTWPILSMVRKSKFRRFVKPGQRLQLNTQLKTLRDESALVRVYASVEGKKTCDAELMFVFNPDDLDSDEAQLRLESLERENLANLWAGYHEWAKTGGSRS